MIYYNYYCYGERFKQCNFKNKLSDAKDEGALIIKINKYFFLNVENSVVKVTIVQLYEIVQK